jgi:predicted nuclease of predicted toxin-antitoxin system
MFLREYADEVIHVNSILDKWYTTDQAICSYADSHDFIVVSKDKDFKNSHFIHLSPKKLLLITLGNSSNERLIMALDRAIKFVKDENKQSSFFVELGSESVLFIK